MKNAKYIISAIIVALIGIIVYQNQSYFLSSHRIHIDLWVVDRYESPFFVNGLIILAGFLFGILSAYFYGLVEKYKLKKSVRNTKDILASKDDRIASLENEIEHLKEKPLLTDLSEATQREPLAETVVEPPEGEVDETAAINREAMAESDENQVIPEKTVVQTDEADVDETAPMTEGQTVKNDDA